MSNPNKAHGRKLFESQFALIEELIRFLARRHRLGTDEREDFTSYAMLKLVENDYGRLQKYRGDSTFRTYLTVVMQRLFLDYRNQKWGKWRPSETAKRLGPTAVKLETLMCRDGLDFHAAREMLLTSTQLGSSEEDLWELANRLPPRERPRRLDDDNALDNLGASYREDDLPPSERRSLMRNVESRLAEESSHLTVEDRVILRMRFEDGRSVPEIADALDLEPKPLYAKIARLLRRLRAGLEGAGVSWMDLEPIVTSCDLSLNLERVFRARGNRPAMSV